MLAVSHRDSCTSFPFIDTFWTFLLLPLLRLLYHTSVHHRSTNHDTSSKQTLTVLPSLQFPFQEDHANSAQSIDRRLTSSRILYAPDSRTTAPFPSQSTWQHSFSRQVKSLEHTWWSEFMRNTLWYSRLLNGLLFENGFRDCPVGDTVGCGSAQLVASGTTS